MLHIDKLFCDSNGWNLSTQEIRDHQDCAIVFLFGDSEAIKESHIYDDLRQRYPNASIVGASSAGNIFDAAISKYPIVASAVHFEKSSVKTSTVDFTDGADIDELIANLLSQLPQDDLQHIFILFDGLNINGSQVIRGLNNARGAFSVSGGIAGDGDRFMESLIVSDEPACRNRIVAVGFYGDSLVISTGCQSGWDSFGPDRIVTKSVGNTLFELDNQPALKLYKEYLGDFAKELPISGMRFPLNIRPDDGKHGVTRTLLAIDEETQSITFAGDIPEGYTARLMKANLDSLIDGASVAAEHINRVKEKRGLGLVVSCVGRRVAMKELVEEELDAIADVLGEDVHLSGFYSYGEIAPFQSAGNHCQLHNQTMTLTVIYEK